MFKYITQHNLLIYEWFCPVSNSVSNEYSVLLQCVITPWLSLLLRSKYRNLMNRQLICNFHHIRHDITWRHEITRCDDVTWRDLRCWLRKIWCNSPLGFVSAVSVFRSLTPDFVDPFAASRFCSLWNKSDNFNLEFYFAWLNKSEFGQISSTLDQIHL